MQNVLSYIYLSTRPRTLYLEVFYSVNKLGQSSISKLFCIESREFIMYFLSQKSKLYTLSSGLCYSINSKVFDLPLHILISMKSNKNSTVLFLNIESGRFINKGRQRTISIVSYIKVRILLLKSASYLAKTGLSSPVIILSDYLNDIILNNLLGYNIFSLLLTLCL